ncbi:hypothetical protein HD554DRAFT_2035183 [Boletus coccyginus]|nr:hypothetical protein HD554DRAFT_2035183 [Boletus coccyginus]
MPSPSFPATKLWSKSDGTNSPVVVMCLAPPMWLALPKPFPIELQWEIIMYLKDDPNTVRLAPYMYHIVELRGEIQALGFLHWLQGGLEHHVTEAQATPSRQRTQSHNRLSIQPITVHTVQQRRSNAVNYTESWAGVRVIPCVSRETSTLALALTEGFSECSLAADQPRGRDGVRRRTSDQARKLTKMISDCTSTGDHDVLGTPPEPPPPLTSPDEPAKPQNELPSIELEGERREPSCDSDDAPTRAETDASGASDGEKDPRNRPRGVPNASEQARQHWKQEDEENSPAIGPDKPDEPGGETAAPDGLQSDPERLEGEGNDNDNDETSASHRLGVSREGERRGEARRGNEGKVTGAKGGQVQSCTSSSPRPPVSGGGMGHRRQCVVVVQAAVVVWVRPSREGAACAHMSSLSYRWWRWAVGTVAEATRTRVSIRRSDGGGCDEGRSRDK